MASLKLMSSRDYLVDLEDDVLRDYVVRHQISRDMTVNVVPSVKSD